MKLHFHFDAFYNGDLYARAGEIKDVPEACGFALRWIRRGATVVEKLQVSPPEVAATLEVSPEEIQQEFPAITPKYKRKNKQKNVVDEAEVVVPLNEETTLGSDEL